MEQFKGIVRPQRVQLARESRMLSQGELSRITNISQAKLSKIETGLLDASQSEIEALSKALNYPPEFFSEFIENYPLGYNFYRKNKTIQSRIIKAIESFINLRRNEIGKLLNSVELSQDIQIPFCDLDDERFGTPEIVAKAIRNLWKLPRGPIKNITELLESAGVIIIPCDLGVKQFSGVHTWSNDTRKLIFVNKNMPGDRLRFTLAHELGHIVMHKLYTETMDVEADRFAAEFLMPTDDIKHQLRGLTLDRAAELKLHWKTSMGAIIVKARSINVITSRQYSYLWMQMGKHGYRTNEPPQFNIPIEKQTLLSEIIELHLKELGFTVSELAAIMKLYDSEFQSIYGIEPKSKLRLLKLK